MANIMSQVMELSRANSGFTGGTAVDTHPECGINECIQRLSAECFDFILEYANAANDLNEKVLSALIESAKSHTAADTKDLINEANEKTGSALSKFWEQLKTWINSIVAKFSTMLTSMKGRQKEIDNRQADFRRAMGGANVKNIKINGYPFAELTGSKINLSALEINNYNDLLSIGGISDNSVSEASAVKAKVDEWVSSKTGFKNNGNGDYKDSLKRSLYGADQAAELSLSTFRPDSVIEVLKNASTIKACEQNYRKLARIVDEGAREARRNAAQGSQPKQAPGQTEDQAKEAQTQNNAPALTQAALAEYNSIMGIFVAAARACTQQAWSIWTTALKGSANNNAQPQQNQQQQNANQNQQATKNESVSMVDEGCGKKKSKNEEAVDDTDELRSAYDESSDLTDDDWDFDI